MTNPSVASIYVVQLGDTLSKISQRFYGTSARAASIADANRIGLNDILPVGRRLQLPPAGLPPAGAGDELAEVQVTAKRPTIPDTYTELPEQSVTARRPAQRWYEDWKIWLGIAAAGGLFWYLSQNGKRK